MMMSYYFPFIYLPIISSNDTDTNLYLNNEKILKFLSIILLVFIIIIIYNIIKSIYYSFQIKATSDKMTILSYKNKRSVSILLISFFIVLYFVLLTVVKIII